MNLLATFRRWRRLFCACAWQKVSSSANLKAASRTRPGPRTSSAGWGSSARAGETPAGWRRAHSAPGLQTSNQEEDQVSWLHSTDVHKRQTERRVSPLLIGWPSRKLILWSTSPCLALRLSIQYLMMLCLSCGKRGRGVEGNWIIDECVCLSMRARVRVRETTTDLRGKKAQFALNVLVDVVLLAGEAPCSPTKLRLHGFPQSHLLGASQ